MDVKEVLEKAAAMFEARKALAEEAEEEKEEDVMELTKKPEITFEDFEKMQFAGWRNHQMRTGSEVQKASLLPGKNRKRQ